MNATERLEIANTIITKLAKQHRQLVAAIDALAADGYPTNSGQGARGKNNISDPTANAALKHDEASQDRQRLRTLIIRLGDITFELDDIRTKYLKPHQPAPTRDAPALCANMYGCPDNALAHKAGRCQECFEHKRAHDRDRR